MRKLHVFNQVSLDGFFTDSQGDMSWAHQQDPEWQAFTTENASGGAELVFGRVTYQMMASYWPTPGAQEQIPEVAKAMNALPKVVFSKTLEEASWNNTRLFKGELEQTIRKLKAEPGKALLIMGSGTIVSQLSRAHLIDEYQLVINPIVLGKGRTLFESFDAKMGFKLKKTRAFTNGNIVSWYEPN